MAVTHLIVGATHLLAFRFASDGAALGQRRASLKCGCARFTRREQRQLLFHLACQRPQVGVLREHPVHQVLESGWHRRIDP